MWKPCGTVLCPLRLSVPGFSQVYFSSLLCRAGGAGLVEHACCNVLETWPTLQLKSLPGENLLCFKFNVRMFLVFSLWGFSVSPKLRRTAFNSPVAARLDTNSNVLHMRLSGDDSNSSWWASSGCGHLTLNSINARQVLFYRPQGGWQHFQIVTS